MASKREGHELEGHELEELDEEETETEQDDDIDVPPELLKHYYVGCGPYHPKWLQVLANKKVFTLLLCAFAITEGALVTGMTSVNLSSIEKRYHLSSTAVGVIPVCFDISVVLSVIFISYFGGRGHKPRWLGISTIVMGTGALIFASPQLFIGPYKTGSTSRYDYELCSDNRTYDIECTSSESAAYFLFVLGKILMGIGAAPLYTLAQAYLDEIVSPNYITLHMGIYHTMGIVGPVFGYGIGSGFLSLYVDPWASTSLTTTDPAWVGAWWISFILAGLLAMLLGIPFLMFPRYLPDSHLIRKERVKEMAKVYSASKYANEGSVSAAFKMFPVHLKRLFLNPSFMLCSLGLGGLYLLSSGLVVFGPQYLQSVFFQLPTSAGLIAGGVSVIVAVCGVLSGALIVHFFKLRGRKIMLLSFLVTLLTVPMVLGLLIHCPTPLVVGINVPHVNGSLNGIDSAPCANECDCLSHVYEPVCGADGLTYFSSCRAGCSVTTNANASFANCSCVAEELASLTNTSLLFSDGANKGKCHVSCKLLIPFIIGVMLVMGMVFLVQIPTYYFTIRAVADDQRSLALGLQSVIWRSTGAIPGPIIFGAIFDSVCLKWEGACHHRGNCWLYDNDRLSVGTVSFAMPIMAMVSVLFLLSCLTFSKKRDSMQQENDSLAESKIWHVSLRGFFTKESEDEDKGNLLTEN